MNPRHPIAVATFVAAHVLAAAAGAQTLVEDQRLFDPTLTAGDTFGAVVATSGARIAVGAPKADIVGTQSGAASVWVASGSGWVLESEVLPFGLFTNDAFGTSLDLEGTRLVVGAPLADSGQLNVGSAYVFERQGDGSWLQVAQLFASDGTTGDGFGHAVALSGDRIVIGAPDDDPAGVNAAGSAYVFERQGNGTWSQVEKLTSANAGASRRFGRRVDIEGDVLVVGQLLAGGAVGGNALFVHRESGSDWPLEHAIASPVGNVPGAADFGVDFELQGGRLLVADPATTPAGRAHLYEATGNAWALATTIDAAPIANSAPVGRSVALHGDVAVLGGSGTNALEGRAALFVRTALGTWRELASLQPNDRSGLPPDDFAIDLAIGSDAIVAGAPRFVPQSGSLSGSAFAFRRGMLMHGATTLAVTGSGQQDFLLLGGAANAFKLHWIVGSASGTAPGTALSPTVTAPLNIDSYALRTISVTNAPPILGSLGLFDADGISKRALIVPPGLSPSLAGLTLHHAYLVFDPFTSELLGASNAVPLTLVP
jgi:hypothetical protein